MLLGRDPALLERHGTDIVERRMQSRVIVERKPIHHLVHGVTTGGELSAVQPADLQPPPQALGGRVVPAVALVVSFGSAGTF